MADSLGAASEGDPVDPAANSASSPGFPLAARRYNARVPSSHELRPVVPPSEHLRHRLVVGRLPVALSHAGSDNSAALSSDMGRSDVFENAIAPFSVTYAEQNQKDHAALARAGERAVETICEEDR